MRCFLTVFLILVSFTFCGQSDDKRSLVSASKVNVVYRGMYNPLSVKVENAKSYTLEGQGVKKWDNGGYTITPGVGLEAKVEVHIINMDDSKSIEEHLFRIHPIPRPMAVLNGLNCDRCIVRMTKSELKTADIDVKFPDLAFDLQPIKIKNLYVRTGRRKKEIFFQESGGQFNEEIQAKIQKLKVGKTFTIGDVRLDYGSRGKGQTSYPRVTPIMVQIIEEPIPYYETREYKRDSLKRIKEERRAVRKLHKIRTK